MKKTCLLLVVVMLTLVTGCSEDSTTGPEDDGNYTLETTETIGSAGGTIEIGDFSLSVPAGAFDGDYTLELYASSEDRPFGQNQVTRAFRLEGLPDEYSQPLRVGILYEGALVEESFIVHGERAFDGVSGDSAVAYLLHSVTDSSGYLVCELPASEEGPTARLHGSHRSPERSQDLIEDAILFGASDLRSLETPHFEIEYPSYLQVHIVDMANLLENSYSIVIDDLGFSYDRKTWEWPMKVVVTTLPSGIGCVAALHEGRPRFRVNADMMTEAGIESMRTQLGAYVLYFALQTYDPETFDPDDDHYQRPTHLWMHAAILAWSRERFTDSPDYLCPPGFPGNEMAPLNGMKVGAGTDKYSAYPHGHGMSAVIKYLAKRLGYGNLQEDDKSGLVRTYEAIRDGADPAAALLSNVDSLVAGWWPGFFREYVGGEVYNVDAAYVFTRYSNLGGDWNIDGEDDTLKVFTGQYPDLSAKLFLIDLNYTAIDTSADMVLEVSGEVGNEPVTMIVFGIKDGPLVYWGHTSVQSEFFEIDRLRDYIDDGWEQILVVVVNSDFDPSAPNPYTGESDIDLEIRVTQELDYNRGSVALGHVEGRYKRDWTDPNEDDDFSNRDIMYVPQTAQGSFEGDTFTGSWDVTTTSTHYVGEIRARLVGDPPDRLAELHLTRFDDEFEGPTAKFSLSVEDIERNLDRPDCYFEVYGESTCEHITAIADTITGSGWQETLEGWTCEENCSIRVHFWTE